MLGTMTRVLLLAAVSLLLRGFEAHGAIPLVTDDTGTQGKGKFQIELFGEYSRSAGGGAKEQTTEGSATLTYGLVNPVDLVVSVPYRYIRTEEGGAVTEADGFSDVTVEAKWRFHESGSWNFALKPGFTIPTGKDTKGLGTGKAMYHVLFITTYNSGQEQFAPDGRRIESPEEKAVEHVEWSVHFNAGYTRNENTVGERDDLWFFSLAGSIEFIEDIYFLADIGAQTNTDPASGTCPAYALGGMIYSPAENVDLGLGIKFGLNKAEPDYAVRGGITVRF